MRPNRLDALTADRLLSGEVSPDDAPPGYAGVAQLLDAAGRGLGAEGSVQEVATVAAMQAAALGNLGSVSAHGVKKMLSKMLAVKAAAVAVVLLGAGSAAAATGSLPAGIQNTTSMVLAKIGISVPGPNDHGNQHAGTRGKSAGYARQGKGPNANATYGLCTAEEAHADSGHQPNAHATVFPSTTTCTSVPHPGEGGTSAVSGQGKGPNANATYGLCTAEEAHTDSGHQPNAHATVFPSTTTCTSVPHPGEGNGNKSNTEGASSTTTERPSGPPSSRPASPTSSGRSHGRA